MTVKAIARVSGVLMLALITFVAWYSIASNYDYDVLSGTYSLRLNGETATLILKKDRSFQQHLIHEGKMEHAQASWRRVGEGGIVFSKELIEVSGQEARPDGQVDAEVRKTLGLFPAIYFDPDPGGPVFRKRYFH
jgi:hypothetical protein